MIDEYDEITARHYSAYRPALHEIILGRCVDKKRKFSTGLDIGCGTGQSVHALLGFCEKVIAIEPSKAMLKNSLPHPKIEYSLYDTKNLAFHKDTFEIVTFAGSLYYGKSQHVLNDVLRVCKDGAVIVVYDFEIKLKDILLTLGFESIQKETYDHEEDFSGLQTNGLVHIAKGREKIDFTIKPKNLAHLILSVTKRYSFFKEDLGKKDMHLSLTEKLRKTFSSGELPLKADIFYNKYKAKK